MRRVTLFGVVACLSVLFASLALRAEPTPSDSKASETKSVQTTVGSAASQVTPTGSTAITVTASGSGAAEQKSDATKKDEPAKIEAATKPVDTKATDAKPDEKKPAETKESKTDVKATDAKAADSKAVAEKSTEAKTADAKKSDDRKEEKKAEEKSSLRNLVNKYKKVSKTGTTAVAAKDATKGEKNKKTNVVLLRIDGEYPEGATPPGLFSEIRPSLSGLVSKLDAAATDSEVSAVWLQIENSALGRGKIDEVRRAIARIRKANKPVIAQLTSAEGGQYLLASACDEVIMPESGMLIIPGVRMEFTFVKGLLDKLGLRFDALQMGKFKGAAEPMTRDAMSPELRESMESLVDDVYQDMVATIVADRNLKDYQVKTLIDQGLFSARMAERAKLIDRIAYSDQVEDVIKEKLKAKSINVIKDYKKRRVDADFSGISGMMKLMGAMMGEKPSQASSNKQKIAVIYAVGEIVDGKSESSMFGSSNVGSQTMIAAIREAEADPKVVAVVMRVDSPGGSAIASDLIWRETQRLSKPYIASMGDVAASGGYYISMGAKKIFATPSTITGSIGVIGGKLVVGGLYEKVGLKAEVISRGANSGSLSSLNEFSADEKRAWTDLLKETYSQFVGKAAKGRGLSFEKLDAMAQGRVYSGMTAKKLGLIDDFGGLGDAIVAAKESAGLKADADVEIITLPQPKTIFEQLFGDPTASADLDSKLGPEFKAVRQAASLRKMLSERVLLWMPYDVELK